MLVAFQILTAMNMRSTIFWDMIHTVLQTLTNNSENILASILRVEE
jgi:hypothetical protein